MTDDDTRSLFSLLEEHDAVDAFSAICEAGCGLRELGRLQQCSGYLRQVLRERCNHVWRELCHRTWTGKLHVPEEARELLSSGRPAAALELSLTDAARTRLTEDELTTTEWRFRFKAQAGEHWQQFDPYWARGEAAHVRFAAMPWPGSGQGMVRMSNFAAIADFELRWRWGECEGRRTLQVVVNGSRVPQYHISRHPRNWGWVMQSCWVVYTSFEMPRPGVEPALDDAGLGVDVDSQRREAALYNMGAAGDPMEDDSDEDGANGDPDDSDDDAAPVPPD